MTSCNFEYKLYSLQLLGVQLPFESLDSVYFVTNDLFVGSDHTIKQHSRLSPSINISQKRQGLDTFTSSEFTR